MARTQSFTSGQTGAVVRGVLTGFMAWAATYTYNTGDITAYGGYLWSSKVDSNLNNTPAEGANWQRMALYSEIASGMYASPRYLLPMSKQSINGTPTITDSTGKDATDSGNEWQVVNDSNTTTTDHRGDMATLPTTDANNYITCATSSDQVYLGFAGKLPSSFTFGTVVTSVDFCANVTVPSGSCNITMYADGVHFSQAFTGVTGTQTLTQTIAGTDWDDYYSIDSLNTWACNSGAAPYFLLVTTNDVAFRINQMWIKVNWKGGWLDPLA